jgi:hypothetical protein
VKRSLLVGLIGAVIATAVPVLGADSCDRDCLEGIANLYVAALAAHDSARVPIADSAKFTENTVLQKPGDGAWKTATGIGTYKVIASDTSTGQVAFMGTLKEGDKTTMFAVRLKVANRRVTESETIIARFGLGGESDLAPGKLVAARQNLSAPLAPAERSPREKMIAIANSYYEGIQQGRGDITPFGDDCQRIENGVPLTNNPSFKFALMSPSGKTPPNIAAMGCKEQFDTGFWATDFIDHRRFPIVDEERGLVLALTTYQAHGTKRCAEVVGFGTVCPAGDAPPATLDLAELFRIKDGKIHEMESIWTILPYRTEPGW